MITSIESITMGRSGQNNLLLSILERSKDFKIFGKLQPKELGTMLKTFACFVASILLLVPSVSEAGLVKVRFDNMSISTASSGAPVFNAGGFTITRSATAGSFNGSSFSVGSPAAFAVQLTYTITTGQSFKDFFDFYRDNSPVNPLGTFDPYANARFDGFGFDIARFVDGGLGNQQATLAAGAINLTQNITGDGFYDFRSQALKSFTGSQIRLTFTGFSGNYDVVSVYAVPEPTAIAFVGSLVAIGCVSGRRRKV